MASKKIIFYYISLLGILLSIILTISLLIFNKHNNSSNYHVSTEVTIFLYCNLISMTFCLYFVFVVTLSQFMSEANYLYEDNDRLYENDQKCFCCIQIILNLFNIIISILFFNMLIVPDINNILPEVILLLLIINTITTNVSICYTLIGE